MVMILEYVTTMQANQFSVVLNKTYLWAVERPKDKFVFIAHVVDACQRFIGKVPKLVKVDESYLLRCECGLSMDEMIMTLIISL